MKPRNIFNLTEDRKFTCNMGDLVPTFLKEVLPGDTFNVNTDLMLRMMPLVSPVMHKVDVYTHFYFVPTRLIFQSWETFIGGGENGDENIPLPTVKADAMDGFGKGSLADYFGLPVDVPNLEVSALPFRAYALIYNEWYRNQNLQSKLPISKGSEQPDVITPRFLQKRNWRKDYFTSALPWTQRGSAVTIPFGDTARVKLDPDTFPTTSGLIKKPKAYGGERVASSNLGSNSNGDFGNSPLGGVNDLRVYDPNGTLVADLSTATSISINALRQAFQIQKWMERNARNGVRYVELLLSHWGVKSSDARLQRPEFLGGGRSPVVVSEVLQTSSTDSTSPQGNMSGHGFSVQSSHGFKRFFEEHGYVIGITSVMPVSNYGQGVERLWSRKTKFDFPFPEFANLGEQEVKVKELYAKALNPERTFGYQPRYEEFRRGLSYLGGEMRDTMSFWHLARLFSSEPYLNSDFVKCNPSKGIFATPSEHTLIVQMVNNVKALRILPKTGIPGFIDH